MPFGIIISIYYLIYITKGYMTGKLKSPKIECNNV